MAIRCSALFLLIAYLAMKVDFSCAGVIQTTLSLVLPAQSTQVSELALTFVVSTTNAPIKYINISGLSGFSVNANQVMTCGGGLGTGTANIASGKLTIVIGTHSQPASSTFLCSIPSVRYGTSGSTSNAAVTTISTAFEIIDGPSNAQQFTINAAPAATGVSPTSAYTSSTVTLTGTGFTMSLMCSAKVGSNPSSGTSALSCMIASQTVTVVVLATSTSAGQNAGFEVTMSNETVSIQITTANFLYIQNNPAAASIAPLAAYAGSTITVTGTNFIVGFACSALVGQIASSGTSATSCALASATTAEVVIASSTPSAGHPGLLSSVQLTVTNGAKVAAVGGTTLAIVANPIVVSIYPSQAYISSIITVIGLNFVSVSQSCFLKIGSVPCSGLPLSHCNISSHSHAVINIDNLNVPLGVTDICISFSNPPSILASSSGNMLFISASPSISSARPAQGYISSTITVFGLNFLASNYTCFLTVGTVQASVCRILSTQSVSFIVPNSSTVGSKVLRLNFNNGGSSATAVAPGLIFNVASSPTLTSFSPNPSYSTCRVTATVRLYKSPSLLHYVFLT